MTSGTSRAVLTSELDIKGEPTVMRFLAIQQVTGCTDDALFKPRPIFRSVLPLASRVDERIQLGKVLVGHTKSQIPDPLGTLVRAQCAIDDCGSGLACQVEHCVPLTR